MSEFNSFKANKRFGQHFLTNQEIVKRMCGLADIGPNTHVLEVGPGPGILTQCLLKTPLQKLTCIEIDTQFIEHLENLAAHHPQLTILKADALKVSLTAIGPCSIIANLPYNVGNQLLINWVHEISLVTCILVMLQKEVVDRITASPSTKAYGRLSILCQALCHTKKEFTVKPGNFSPPPKVDSAVVHLIPKDNQTLKSIKALSHLTASLFQSRRKMVGKTLNQLFPALLAECEKIGVLPTMRPENITVDQYVHLANVLIETENGELRFT